MTVETERFQVDIDLGSGRLTVDGQEIAYVSPGLRLEVGIDDVPTLLIPTIALGGRVSGEAEVSYQVTLITGGSGNDPWATGPTIPAALRNLARLLGDGA